MDPDKQTTPLSLMAKYLAGEATPGEAMLMDEWLKDRKNKKEFDRISKLWHQVSKISEPAVPGKKEAWLELQAATGIKGKAKVMKTRFYQYAAAACLAALIIISAVTLLNKKSTSIPQDNAITIGLHNSVSTDTLPDGSRITLNKNSSLTYSSSFNKNRREVTLKGESYFDIAPDRSKPFIITVDDLEIKVVGTSFNVHPVNDRIEVQVRSGIVQLTAGNNAITVTKGQTGIYIKKDHSLAVRDFLDLNSISYATKSFYFHDISLSDAFTYIEDAFNVTINFDHKKFAACRLTAEFESKPMNYILDVISATLDINYKISGRNIDINGEGCK